MLWWYFGIEDLFCIHEPGDLADANQRPSWETKKMGMELDSGTTMIQETLVGGLEHVFSHIIGNVIIPTDFYIFQSGWNHQPVP